MANTKHSVKANKPNQDSDLFEHSRSMSSAIRSLLVASLVAAASAQFGRKRSDEHAAGSLGDLGGAESVVKSDVDLAMEGWKQVRITFQQRTSATRALVPGDRRMRETSPH